MEKYQQQAWECLTEREQNSLFLTLAHGKSGRETEEILKITHYKYLELKARSEKFFKLFSDYFELHEALINPEAPLDRYFKDYLYASMVKRMPKEEAQVYAGESSWLLKPVRDPQILRNMKRLKESSSESKWDADLYALILEFDRWNTYRILPRELRAPTPYKQKANKLYKAYMKYLHKMPQSKISNLIDYFWVPTSKKTLANRYFTVFISRKYPEGYVVVPISKKNNERIQELTNLKMYIFEERMNAEEFGIMVSTYFSEVNNVKRGHKFWREFGEVLETALNYREINNMDFTTSSLDKAYSLTRHQIRNMRKPAE